MKMNKKGAIDNVTNMIIPILVIAIALVVGILVIASAKDQVSNQGNICAQSNLTYNVSVNVCCNSINCTEGGVTYNLTTPGELSYAGNASDTTMDAIDDVTGWLPIIIVTMIGAILIGLVSVFRRR